MVLDFINKYRKAIIAAIGLLLIVGKDVFGFDLDSANADRVLDTVIAVVTSLTVVAVPNVPARRLR